jgi:hypothetical protein
VEAAVREQWPAYAVHLDQPHPLRTYADFVRTIWQGLGDIVIVEGDSIPPPGAIRGLLDCEHVWCSHPSWVGDRYLHNTLGLVKFSLGLQSVLPGLADEALSRPHDFGRHHDRGLGWEKPNRHLGVVPVEPSVLAIWPELAGLANERALLPGTTIHPKAIDMALNRVLEIRKVPVHVHQPPAPHLRYGNDPAWNARWPASLSPRAAGRGRIE